MPITTNVSTFANTRIDAYRELAKKATETGGAGVDSQDSGVVAALKRFFYKLDFLLKYGHFPSGEDTAQDALPPKLQGLRDFLRFQHYGEEGYILQKDANTRYRFVWSDSRQIIMTEEIRTSTFPADVRATLDANVTWYPGDIFLYQSGDLLVGLGLEQPVAEQPVQTVAELFRSELNNFFETNKLRNELILPGEPNAFVIKTEITNDGGRPSLLFSFNGGGEFSDDITYTFENEREMIKALSGACCHSPLTDIVSDGEKRCSLLGHILEKAVQADISLLGINLNGANLNGANLNGANLTMADLNGTYLNGAHMENANLTWAHMEGAHVKGAHVKGAKGVNLEGAYMN